MDEQDENIDGTIPGEELNTNITSESTEDIQEDVDIHSTDQTEDVGINSPESISADDPDFGQPSDEEGGLTDEHMLVEKVTTQNEPHMSQMSPAQEMDNIPEKGSDSLVGSDHRESGESGVEDDGDDGDTVRFDDNIIKDDDMQPLVAEDKNISGAVDEEQKVLPSTVDEEKDFDEEKEIPSVVDEAQTDVPSVIEEAETDLQSVVEEVEKVNIEEESKEVENESSDDGEICDEIEQSTSLPVHQDDSRTSLNNSASKCDSQISLLSEKADFQREDSKTGKKSNRSAGIKSSEVRGHKAKVKQSEMILDMHGDELDYEEDVEHGEQQPTVGEEKGEIVEMDDAKDEKKKTSESELEEGEYDETEDGEIKDDEDEEGEVKDPHGRKPFVRQTCRFYQRGQCTWGLSCRFVHPGYNDKGNYMMIGRNEIQNLHASILAPPRPATPPPEEEPPRPIIPEEPKVETAWEKGLRHAKELRKKAQMRKEQDEDFEEKRLTAELSDEGDEDYNKENLYRNRDEFYGYHLGGDESPVREVVMKEPTLPQQYAATIHVGRINREDVRRSQPPPVSERSYDRYPKAKREQATYNRQEKIRPADSRNRIEPKVPFVNRPSADSWHDPWARARSPKKVAGAKGRRRHSSHSSFSSSSSSRSRSSSYSSYTSRSRSSSSSFSSRSRSGSRSSRSYSKSRSRTPSPRSRPSTWQSSKHPSRTAPSNNSQSVRGRQSTRGRPAGRTVPPASGGGLASRSGQSKHLPSKSAASSTVKPTISQTSKPAVVKPTVVKKVEPIVLKVKASAKAKKLSIPPIHFQKQIKKVRPIADHLRPSKERSLSSSSRSSRSSRSSSRSGSSRSRSRSFSRSRSRSQSYSSISSRSRSPVSRASSVSADSEHMYANLASPVSSASSDISDTPIPKETKVKPVKISITKKTVSVATKKPLSTKTKQGIVKAKPSSAKQKVAVKAQVATAKAVSNQPKKVLPKSKAIKPLPDSQSSTVAKKTAKVTPMPATSSNIVSKPSQKAKQPTIPSKTSGTSSAAISHDRSDPLKYTAHKDIKLTLLKKPTETTSKKRALEASTQSIAKKTKPPTPASTKPKAIKEVGKKSIGNAKAKVTSGANPPTKAATAAAANTTKAAQEKAVVAESKAATGPTQAKAAAAAVTKKGTKSRREELLKQLKEVEEAIARKRAKLAGT